MLFEQSGDFGLGRAEVQVAHIKLLQFSISPKPGIAGNPKGAKSPAIPENLTTPQCRSSSECGTLERS
jgi:hypothetical protein